MAAKDFSELPEVWAEPAQALCSQIVECNEEIEFLNLSIKQIEGRLDYWSGRKIKFEKQLESLLSGYDERLFGIPESKIHQLFEEQFSADFEIHHEVCGKYDTDIAPKKPKIDFLMRPRQRLVGLGFPLVWVGIEAKAPKDDRQAIQVIQQAENYRIAVFNRPDADIVNARPDMVLIYPPIDFFFRSASEAKTLKMHAHKSRVGSIQFHRKTPYRQPHWTISFADDTAYFHSDTGLVNGGAVLNNTYLGNGKVMK